MKCSVVIPLYNAQHTIISTLQSCLQQTLKPFEIIVVDDCSTDGSLDAIQEEFGNQIKLLHQAKNQGPSAARNAGWNAAQGDFVAFLDSDDVWHPRKLEICAMALKAQPGIDLLWHDYQFDDLPKYSDVAESNIGALHTKLFRLLVRNPVSSSAIIYKKSLPIRFDETMRYCEDYQIVLQTAYSYNIVQVPLFLTKIGRPILAKGGLSSNVKNMRKGEIQSYYSLIHLNPLFYCAYPFLVLWSKVKHLRTITKGSAGTSSRR